MTRELRDLRSTDSLVRQIKAALVPDVSHSTLIALEELRDRAHRGDACEINHGEDSA